MNWCKRNQGCAFGKLSKLSSLRHSFSCNVKMTGLDNVTATFFCCNSSMAVWFYRQSGTVSQQCQPNERTSKWLRLIHWLAEPFLCEVCFFYTWLHGFPLDAFVFFTSDKIIGLSQFSKSTIWYIFFILRSWFASIFDLIILDHRFWRLIWIDVQFYI